MQLKFPKPRNPVAVELRNKRNAPHGKTRKAERRQANINLKRDWQ
jgi:hypothetical protein